MKKSNRLSVRVLALLMTFVMLFSFSATVFAAQTGIVTTDYYTVSYDSTTDIPEIVVSVDAAALGAFLAERNFTKNELKKFLPEIIAEALETRTLPSVNELVDFFPEELFSKSELAKLIPTELLKKYLTAELLEEMLPKSEWADVLPIEDVIDDAEIEYVLETYPAVAEKLMTQEVIDVLVTPDVLKSLMFDENASKLFTTDVAKTVVSEELVNKLVEKGVLSEDVLVELITDDADKEEIANATDKLAKATEIVLGKYTDGLAALLLANTNVVIELLDANTLINAVGAENAIKTIGMTSIIEKVGMDAILEKVEMENVIDAVLTNTDEEYIARLAVKVLESPNFDFNKVFDAVDREALKTKVKDILIRVFLNDIESLEVFYNNNGDLASTVYAYDPTTYQSELNLQKLSAAILYSVPDSNDLLNMNDGDTFYMIGLGMHFNADSDTYGFKVRVVLDGDTSAINYYAEELITVLQYNVVEYADSDAHGINVNIADFDDAAPISFAELLTKALTTSRLTDAEKAKLFTIFTKEGQDFIDALNEFDFNVSWIDAKYVPYLEEIRDKMMIVLEQAIDASSVDYTTVSLADLYNVDLMQFVLNDNVSVPTEKLINKLCTTLGVSQKQFDMVFNNYEEYVRYILDLSFGMADVYRVRYFDTNGELIYTTFLPNGADLAVINNNTADLNGKAGVYGWADVTGNLVTAVGSAHLDLYPANTLPSDTKTYTATFVADGQVVARVQFKEGDTKLSSVPQVPEKIGYHGRWEDYKLGNQNITIDAIYTEKTYTVIYDANGGEGTMATQILTYDRETALRACTFTRAGYTFLGWNTKADGTGTFYADQQVVKNMTIVDGVILYAQWQVVAPTVHTVTFMANGVVVDKVTYNDGDTELSRVPEVPARVGYTGAWEAFTLTNTDITVNAEYTANEYTVVFNANGGAGANMPNQTMTYDTFAKLTANTYTYAGYNFAGWNTEADGTGTSYADGENVKNLAESGEVTLYAQWDEAESSSESSSETTTAPVDQDGGFNWLVLVIVLAVLAVAGGVVGFLVYKKKNS